MINNQQDPEQTECDHHYEAGHDVLPVSPGERSKGTSNSHAENGQAQLESIEVGGFVVDNYEVYEKIAEYQDKPYREAYLSIPIVENVVVPNETLFVGRIGKRQHRSQGQAVGLFSFIRVCVPFYQLGR